MNKDNIKGVLFDLDGTLVDNFSAIHACLSYSAKKLGLEVPSYEATVRAVGGSILITMGKLFDSKYAIELAEIYSENFYRFMYDDLELLPYAEDFLKALVDKGITVACFTNKEEEAAKSILKKVGLIPYFSAVIGTTLTSVRKPSAEFTNSALKRLGVSIENALIVGDSLYDYNAGVNAKVGVLLVSTGNVPKEELKSSATKALGVYDNMKALANDFFALDI